MISLLAIFIVFLYGMFLLWCYLQWISVPEKAGETAQACTSVSVILAARNESQNILNVLGDLAGQDFPQNNFEVIICDDHSEDDTYTKSQDFISSHQLPWKIIHCIGTGKKNALSEGIQKSSNPLILITDADIRLGNDWIKSITQEYCEHKPTMICGPVQAEGSGFFGKLQMAELAGLAGISASGIFANRPMMCNGANMAFEREAYHRISGFKGSTHASGDDTQLLQKISSIQQGSIRFIKDRKSIVRTKVHNRIMDWFFQRRRWASKITTLSVTTILTAALAWITHALLLIQLIILPLKGSYMLLLLLLSMKVLPEYVFLQSVGRFFNQQFSLLFLLVCQPFYCLYIALTGLLAGIGNQVWKGRTVK